MLFWLRLGVTANIRHPTSFRLLFLWSLLQVKKLQEQVLKPREQVTLEPYERDHAMVVGVYRPPPKKKQ